MNDSDRKIEILPTDPRTVIVDGEILPADEIEEPTAQEAKPSRKRRLSVTAIARLEAEANALYEPVTEVHEDDGPKDAYADLGGGIRPRRSPETAPRRNDAPPLVVRESEIVDGNATEAEDEAAREEIAEFLRGVGLTEQEVLATGHAPGALYAQVMAARMSKDEIRAWLLKK